MKFKFEFDERKITELAMKAAEEAIRKKISSLRCPVHGESP
jgi:hypothetical protein